MSINYNKDIVRGLFAIVLGVMLSKYTSYSFNFQIPIIALATVTNMNRFSIKIFIKENCWVFISAAIGLIVSEIFYQKFALFYILTFGIFFTCFYFIDKNLRAAPSIILGYSFTTIYGTYNKLNMEVMVYDVFIVTVLGGLLGFLLLLLIPKEQKEESKNQNMVLEKSPNKIKNILIVTTIVFLIWMFYTIYDIKDTFFAYAALAGIYGNIDVKKIYRLTPLNIGINLTGCFLATIYSFLVIGLDKFFLLFGLSLGILFFPMLYFKYYGDTVIIKSISNGLLRATIIPLVLYLTPFGDITSRAGARALQIAIMLMSSLVVTRILIFLEGEENG